MGVSFTIPTIFTATDKFSSVLSKFEGKLKGVARASEDISRKAAIVGTAVALPLILAANEAIKFEDKITVDLNVTKATADYSRWSIRHHLYKEDGTLCAVINLDGAWIDIVKRKLAVPNEFIQTVFQDFPKAEDFESIILTKK